MPSTTGLTREDVARTALDLVDRGGLPALTMRRLAAELGVGTMTLYGYVRTKDELLDAVLDAAAQELAPPQTSGSWRDRARVHALAFRTSLLRHPELVVLRSERPMLRPSQFRVTEEVIAAMVDAGFPAPLAAAAFRSIFTYVFGSALVETSPEGQDAARRALAGLPRDDFPVFTSMIDDAVGTMRGEEQFLLGLDALLDGLERLLDAL